MTETPRTCDNCGRQLDARGDYLCPDCREAFEQKFEETRAERRQWIEERRRPAEQPAHSSHRFIPDAAIRLVEQAYSFLRENTPFG